jgi:hypothetical protein
MLSGLFQDLIGRGWLDYGDQQVASLRRSTSGSIAPFINWLDCGDHGLAL